MYRRLLTIISTLALLVLCSCSKIKQIELKSCSVASISMSGLRGVTAQLLLEIDNPALQFTLSDVDGVIYYKGEEYGTYTAGPIEVKGKTCAVYPLDCKASVSPNVSLLELVSLAKSIDMEQVTTDINVRITLKKGVSKHFKIKDLHINDLLEEEI